MCRGVYKRLNKRRQASSGCPASAPPGYTLRLCHPDMARPRASNNQLHEYYSTVTAAWYQVGITLSKVKYKVHFGCTYCDIEWYAKLIQFTLSLLYTRVTPNSFLLCPSEWAENRMVLEIYLTGSTFWTS